MGVNCLGCFCINCSVVQGVGVTPSATGHSRTPSALRHSPVEFWYVSMGMVASCKSGASAVCVPVSPESVSVDLLGVRGFQF